MPRFINNAKTTVLLAALMALFVVVGRQIGGPNGMVLALILGGTMNIVAYFFSDKLAVAMMRAKPVNESDATEIYSIVRYLSQRADLPMPKVYIAPAETPNAFATGRNPNNALVCLTEGIISQLNRSELTAVIAHELAHIDQCIGLHVMVRSDRWRRTQPRQSPCNAGNDYPGTDCRSIDSDGDFTQAGIQRRQLWSRDSRQSYAPGGGPGETSSRQSSQADATGHALAEQHVYRRAFQRQKYSQFV